MWRPRAPGLTWLLAHELRLGWRATGAVRSRVIAALGLIVIALAHVAAGAVLHRFNLQAALHAAPVAIIGLTAFLGVFVAAAAFGIASQVLFSRGDLDLLLSSPVPVSHVYAARGMAVAIGSVGTMAMLLVPVANAGPFVGKWGTLAAYPVVLSFGMGCAAVALAATLWLVRRLGQRRARTVAQVVGALVGASLLIAMQLQAMLPKGTRAALASWGRHDAVAWWLAPESPLTWPLRAFMGEALPAVAMVLAGTALFAFVIRATSADFAALSRQAPPAPAARPAPSREGRTFRGSLARIVIVKELTLLSRDPSLIGRSLLQVLFLLPLFFILMGKTQAPALIAGAVVMIAASLASSLAWMTMSGEEAPDLLGSAPLPMERVRWLKVAAALLPVAALLVPFVAWFAWHSPTSVPVVVGSLAAALTSSAVVQVWTARPGSRRDLQVRYRENVVVNLAEQLSAFGWGLACFLALFGSALALFAVPLGLLSPVVAWFWGRRRRG